MHNLKMDVTFESPIFYTKEDSFAWERTLLKRIRQIVDRPVTATVEFINIKEEKKKSYEELKMSIYDRESDFSKDFGKTIPVNRSIWIRPINHRCDGLTTGIHHIDTANFNKQTFCIGGHWHRMSDYFFGVVEPE